MDLPQIENQLLALSPYVKSVEAVLKDGFPHAILSPDFQALKAARIVNIDAELRWYCVELYNMQAKENQKIRSYTILKNELQEEEEPDDTLYQTLKNFLFGMCKKEVFPSSHLELDLGLDSLNYVELFVFVEESFGVYMDEAIFSNIMVMKDFYAYIKAHQKIFSPTKMDWKQMFSQECEEKLIYSPYIMFLYKIVLFPLFKLYFALEVQGVENIPKSSSIIAPSHQSMLDGFLIEASLPYSILKNTFFLAFEAVFGTKLLRPISDHGQTLLIDANNNLIRSMKRASLPLKEGKYLVIFPEGARTRDRKLLEFRPFFAMLSTTYNVPVVPVVIDGSFEALRAGKLFPKPKKIRLTYLPPIYPEGLNYEEITAKVKEAIQNEIEKNSHR